MKLSFNKPMSGDTVCCVVCHKPYKKYTTQENTSYIYCDNCEYWIDFKFNNVDHIEIATDKCNYHYSLNYNEDEMINNEFTANMHIVVPAEEFTIQELLDKVEKLKVLQ